MHTAVHERALHAHTRVVRLRDAFERTCQRCAYVDTYCITGEYSQLLASLVDDWHDRLIHSLPTAARHNNTATAMRVFVDHIYKLVQQTDDGKRAKCARA